MDPKRYTKNRKNKKTNTKLTHSKSTQTILPNPKPSTISDPSTSLAMQNPRLRKQENQISNPKTSCAIITKLTTPRATIMHPSCKAPCGN